jgi:hypothetical protein
MIVNDRKRVLKMELYSEKNKQDIVTAVNRIRGNAGEFLIEHRRLLYLLVIAGFVDLLSTIHFMQIIGPEKELHPIIRYLGYEYGPVIGPSLGKFSQIFFGLFAVLYFRKHAKFILAFVAVMYSWAAVANFLAYIP